MEILPYFKALQAKYIKLREAIKHTQSNPPPHNIPEQIYLYTHPANEWGSTQVAAVRLGS